MRSPPADHQRSRTLLVSPQLPPRYEGSESRNTPVSQRFPEAFSYQKTRTESRGYPGMQAETAARLRAFYRPYNGRLEAYLGRSFGW